MCLTIPGKIKTIKNGLAIVENGNRTEQIELGIVYDAKVGDWVLYATNRAVRLIDENEAHEIIELLEDNYQPVDTKALPLVYKKIVTKIRRDKLTGFQNQKSKVKDQNDNEKSKYKKISEKQDTRNKQITNTKFQIPNEISKSQKNECHSERSDNGVEESYHRVSGSKDNLEDSLQNTQNENKKNLPTVNRQPLTKTDLEYLLNLKGTNNLEAFYSEANVLRKEKIKDFVCIHGIVEFSNYCKNDCLYCGIGRSAKIRRYRMNCEEIYKAVKKAVDVEGYKLVVLQSGEDDYYSDNELVALIDKIKKDIRVFVFISVGERSKDFYRRAFRAGASGSLFRFETSNSELYRQMHPNHELQSRLDSLQMQIELGYYVASGGLIGLPGQTVGDLADDLLLVAKLGVPMLSSGPYISSRNNIIEKFKVQNLKFKNMEESIINSKYEARNPKQIQNSKSQIPNRMTKGVIARKDEKAISNNLTIEQFNNEEKFRLTLNYIAAARFQTPEIKIPVTTALETLDPESGRHKALLAGANALMFNITPEKYRDDYNLYDHKYIEREKVWQKYGLFKGEESYEMLEERLKI